MPVAYGQEYQNNLPKNFAFGKYFNNIGHCTINKSVKGYKNLDVNVGRSTLAMLSININFAPSSFAKIQKNTTTPAPVEITTLGLSTTAIYPDKTTPIIHDNGLYLTILGIVRRRDVLAKSLATSHENVK
jgi:hypothetical protein